ncbi:hypothetical protein MYE70_00585 [Marinobacter alexandrii]|uniref:hypothetical protein n=1 Tax=Marinobacter alexandrii TaxID=2570351 RepID=UPI002000058E|nr:hypothetical protein [Marinobacter alexandrii]MCK2147553.1 hypothetical protein [Marinobacter alexandrii]
MAIPQHASESLRVAGDALTPCQQPTERNFRVATDFRVAQMLKHPTPCEFHSIAEYFHALLLEGDPQVSRYVPQPFFLRIGKRQRRYKPDCYVVRNGFVDVVELRPRAEFDEHRRQTLAAFFQTHRMRFVVLANETVLARRCEALNWQKIVQTLVLHRDLATESIERELLDDVIRRDTVQLGHYVWRGDRASSRPREIALLRLLHRGKLSADLDQEPFGYHTELRPCA